MSLVTDLGLFASFTDGEGRERFYLTEKGKKHLRQIAWLREAMVIDRAKERG